MNLISSIIKDWGCDCVFFFNFNRINMGVANLAVEPHLVSMFGPERLSFLRDLLSGKTPHEREIVIVENLCDALKEKGSKFVLPFRFKNAKGDRTSHHLIFLSKDFRGYDIMKDIMWRETTDHRDGVAISFEYNPRDSSYRQGSLFDSLSLPLDELEGMLLNTYCGRTIDFLSLYEEHSVNKPFVRKNYKKILTQMFEDGKISAKNAITGKPPRKGTFSDKMQIIFGDSK
ncbi:MAG: three-Cys-motif partner protein TcmP [Kiritimatiellae bacterium]|nr:three-Cys-motif partner protein TcmP [Kiritimatiellia bacterium]